MNLARLTCTSEASSPVRRVWADASCRRACNRRSPPSPRGRPCHWGTCTAAPAKESRTGPPCCTQRSAGTPAGRTPTPEEKEKAQSERGCCTAVGTNCSGVGRYQDEGRSSWRNLRVRGRLMGHRCSEGACTLRTTVGKRSICSPVPFQPGSGALRKGNSDFVSSTLSGRGDFGAQRCILESMRFHWCASGTFIGLLTVLATAPTNYMYTDLVFRRFWRVTKRTWFASWNF